MIHFRLRQLALTSVYSIVLCGCSNDRFDSSTTDLPINQAPMTETVLNLGNGLKYDAESNAIIREADGFSIENPLFAQLSSDQRYLIFSATENGEDPEVFLRDAEQRTWQITDNSYIEPIAAVNDDGIFAYVLSDHIENRNELYLLDNLVDVQDPSRDITHITISRSHLIIGTRASDADISYIEIYDLATADTRLIELPGLVQSLAAVSDSQIAIQVFDPSTRALTALIYNVLNDRLSPLLSIIGDQYFWLEEDGTLHVDVVSGDDDAVRLFNALYTWRSHYLTNSLGYSNNFLARLSWNSSYVIEGLIELYRVTGHSIFRIQAANSIAAQLSAKNEFLLPGDTRVPSFLWATTKYALDKKTPLVLFVDDAKVLYPMLVAANDGLLPPIVRNEVLSTATAYIDRLESQYSQAEKLYHIDYGIYFAEDGLWAPYNWQSALGLVHIELFAALGEDRYRDRASELAARFRSEWLKTSDDRLLWHYWPIEFYNGWVAGDGLSANTPTRTASTDVFFEDLSHAGLNLKFVIEYRKRFGRALFTDNDLSALRRTAQNFTFDSSFSRHMSGDLVYTPALYRYLPLYGWPELESSRLSPFYASFIPYSHPSTLLAYLNSMTWRKDSVELTVGSYTYNVDRGTTLTGTSTYNLSEIPTYFGLH